MIFVIDNTVKGEETISIDQKVYSNCIVTAAPEEWVELIKLGFQDKVVGFSADIEKIEATNGMFKIVVKNVKNEMVYKDLSEKTEIEPGYIYAQNRVIKLISRIKEELFATSEPNYDKVKRWADEIHTQCSVIKFDRRYDGNSERS